MEILIGDHIKKEAGAKFGIGRSLVENTINYPDNHLPITLGAGLEVHFYSKYIKLPKNPYYLIIHGHMQDNAFIIGMAWKIYSDLYPDIDTLNPLQILHEFTSKFGLLVTIGDVTDHIIYRKNIPVSSTDPSRIVSIANPKNHSFYQSINLRVTHTTGQPVAECALAYCIDTEKYQKWINR